MIYVLQTQKHFIFHINPKTLSYISYKPEKHFHTCPKNPKTLHISYKPKNTFIFHFGNRKPKTTITKETNNKTQNPTTTTTTKAAAAAAAKAQLQQQQQQQKHHLQKLTTTAATAVKRSRRTTACPMKLEKLKREKAKQKMAAALVSSGIMSFQRVKVTTSTSQQKESYLHANKK